jgi:hypothetical protein
VAARALSSSCARNDDAFISSESVEPGAPVLLATTGEGRCVFHDRDAHRCRIQNALGHDALPLACRQFPRVTVRDPRGVSVTLSHYCPTAASLLLSEGPVTIVTGAPAFPSGGEYIGLDAESALPPRLRPDLLMDWDSWWEWERLSVERLGAAARADDALARLSVAVAHISRWHPVDGPLIERVREAHRAADERTATRPDGRDVVEDVLAAIPEEHRPRALPAPARVSGLELSRFVAAHAFANWTAHYGTGLRAWLRSLEAACALASRFGVRQADLWLRHLADPAQLAGTFSRARPA